MKSLSEIDTISKRASKAVGFSWGIAEEIGKNTRLLEMFGLRGIKHLNYYFKLYKKQKFQNVSVISKLNSSKIEGVIVGKAIYDKSRNLKELSKLM